MKWAKAAASAAARWANGVPIGQILLSVTAALTLIIVILLARQLSGNFERLERAQDLRGAIVTSDRLFDAMERVSLERDLALAMLQSQDEATIEELTPRLAEARSAADAAVAVAADALDHTRNADLGQLRQRLRERHVNIQRLRPMVDAAIALPPGQRNADLRARWERTATSLLNETEELWTRFVRPYANFDAVATQHLRYGGFLRTITDYTGRERSIVGQILSENSDPTTEELSALLRGQGVLDLAWRSSRVLAEQTGIYTDVAPTFSDAESHLATLHDMSRDMFSTPVARQGGLYPLSPDLWFELSDQASQSLQDLLALSRSMTRNYMDRTITDVERAIAVQALIFVAAIGLCIFSFWAIVSRVIRPINQIVDALSRATAGEEVAFVSDPNRSDEIGKLSGVLQAFQKNLAQIRREEEKTHAQLERLALLHQISRAIGERQDLESIFDVAVRNVEERFPADFACVCLREDHADSILVAHVGAKSAALADALAMTKGAQVEIGENGLAKCLSGRLVYEPDMADVGFPFPQRLAGAGLYSLVATPLQIESRVFGALLVARREAGGFVSMECEFLRQLGEHIALAAHQAQLSAALQAAYDDLRQTQDAVLQQERLRALGQMASGIAHDINNALSPIALYTESVLATEAGLTQTGRGKLEIIQRAIDDAAATIARMSEFYRRRDKQLALGPVRASIVVQQVLDLTQARWRDMAQERGDVFEMRADIDPDLPAILGIESELREALTNLVFNAIDAMPQGGRIELRARRAPARPGLPQRILIEVADTGLGMDEATRQRCLEPFFTTKGERGTGLGLPMVYGAVQRHNGDLEIESTLGKGTIVRLVLDAAPDAVKPRAQSDLAPHARLRLLVVDDDPILLRTLRDVLEADGHDIVSANDGAAALEAFAAALAGDERFDAVVTDLGMPRIDGRRVAAGVKQMSPATPVIMLTGWGERLKAEEDTPEHVDCVLSKPAKLGELRAALAYACGAATQRHLA